jgi:hypothetical protein
MSYTHNIYIPYTEDFHDKEKFNFYKKYYNDIGFNVKPLNISNDSGVNYTKIINDTITSGNEEVYIIIDSVIVSKFSINLAIELSENYNCLIKPVNKVYMIDNEDSMNSIMSSIINETDITDLYYDIDKRYETWPMGGAWVIPASAVNENIKINENIDIPLAFDFEFCYKNSIFNKIIFLQTDGYKLKPSHPYFNINAIFLYKEYLRSMMNIFGSPENVFKNKNMVLEKVEKDKIEDIIFNVERYMSIPRYI